MKTEKAKKTIINSTRQEKTFSYFLTAEQGNEQRYNGVTQYGICVANIDGSDEAEISNVSCDKGEVAALVDLLAVNAVTPTTLYDVVYDWICKKCVG